MQPIVDELSSGFRNEFASEAEHWIVHLGQAVDQGQRRPDIYRFMERLRFFEGGDDEAFDPEVHDFRSRQQPEWRWQPTPTRHI